MTVRGQTTKKPKCDVRCEDFSNIVHISKFSFLKKTDGNDYQTINRIYNNSSSLTENQMIEKFYYEDQLRLCLENWVKE